MKVTNLILGLFVGGALLSSCVDDDLNVIGSTIQPEGDKITEFRDTIYLQTATVHTDSIYARTSKGSLGELYDPLYGNLKSDYMCQFYCPENFKFKHTPVDAKIDSIDFVIYYSRYWVGDSLTPMKAEAYLVTQPLAKNYYTNINPQEYCDMQNALGSKTYTSRDFTVSDSLWFDTTTTSAGESVYSYAPKIRIKMPKELGQKFYDETINNPGSFKNQKTFNEFFPGLYVTNTFGSGNIIRILSSEISIHYNYKKESDGKDSTVMEIFNVTNEVVQMNRFKNTDLANILNPDQAFTYLKTPAGIFTQITIPIKEVAPIVKERLINNFPLELKAMPQGDWIYALSAPQKLLLLPEDSLKTFFEEGLLYNNITSYKSTYDLATRSYKFGNIANLIKNQLEKAPDKDLLLVVVPIEEETQTVQYVEYPLAVSNYLFPSGVKLRKDKEAMQLVVTTTKYNN